VVNSLIWYQPKQSYTASAPPSLHHSRRRPLSTPADRRLTPSLSSPLPLSTMATLPMQPSFFLDHVASYAASSCGAPPGATLYTALPQAGHGAVPYGTSSYGAPPGAAPYAALLHAGYVAPTRLLPTPAVPSQLGHMP
jgi:hypothetical protein